MIAAGPADLLAVGLPGLLNWRRIDLLKSWFNAVMEPANFFENS